MNLIFLNSLEKKVAEDRVMTAQVSICEYNGGWHVFWNEPQEDGKPAQTVWFEGIGWSDMLHAFRDGLYGKMTEGFKPLVDGTVEVRHANASRPTLVTMLHYYSEKHPNDGVCEQLKAWRREQSGKEGKAPFIVAANRTLAMLASLLPHTEVELRQIPGFGESRIRSYGAAVLAITRQTERETQFPLDWVAAAVDAAGFEEWQTQQQLLKYKQEQEKRRQKLALLEAIADGNDLTALVKRLSLRRADIVQTIEQLDQEGYDVTAVLDMELQRVDGSDLNKTEQLFRELGDRYLKPVLQRLYSADELQRKDVNHVYEWLRLYRIKYRKEAVSVK